MRGGIIGSERQMTMNTCDRRLLAGYISDTLNDEARLDFLLHVDSCPSCWNEVYLATKSQHPHYYKGGKQRRKKPGRLQKAS